MLRNLSVLDCPTGNEYAETGAIRNAYLGIMSVQRVSRDVLFVNISLEMEAR